MDVVFRWAFGYNSYYWRQITEDSPTCPLDEKFFHNILKEYKKRWANSSIPEELFILKLSIDSVQSLYPGYRYVLMDNSSGIRGMLEQLDFREPVEVIRKSDFESPFPFNPPESVWWKWVPLSMGDIDIFIDIDSIFLGKQTVLPQWIGDGGWALFVRELSTNKYFYKIPLVANMAEHINVGLIASRSGLFSKMFTQSSKSIPYSNDYWSNFFAESECGNLTYCRLKAAADDKVLLTDGRVFTWWDGDFISPRMEWCHFVGAERKVAMMAFYSLLAKFIELGEQITEVDKGLLLTLTQFGTPRALEPSIPILFSDAVRQHYNRLCLLYNVQIGVHPPVDLIEKQPDYVPGDAIFQGVERDNNTVKASYRHGCKQYVVEGNLSDRLQVKEETYYG